MVNHIFGCIDNSRSFITQQSPAIVASPLFIAIYNSWNNQAVENSFRIWIIFSSLVTFSLKILHTGDTQSPTWVDKSIATTKTSKVWVKKTKKKKKKKIMYHMTCVICPEMYFFLSLTRFLSNLLGKFTWHFITSPTKAKTFNNTFFLLWKQVRFCIYYTHTTKVLLKHCSHIHTFSISAWM